MATVPQPRPAADRRPGSAAPIFWGLLLIGAGLVLLVLTLGIVPAPTGGAVGAMFALAGVALLAAYVAVHAHWWTLIAGPPLLALGALILLPDVANGAIFLGGIGVGFALVAITSIERRWWAIIPAGVMLTLALVASLSGTLGGILSGALLFTGIGATFGVLAVIRIGGRTARWPIYPALACLLFAVLIASDQFGAILWPVLFIAAGLALLFRATVRRS